MIPTFIWRSKVTCDSCGKSRRWWLVRLTWPGPFWCGCNLQEGQDNG